MSNMQSIELLDQAIDMLDQGVTHPPDYDNMCLICHEELNETPNNEKYTLECKHKYHTACIVTWFRSGNDNCPYCGDKGVNQNKNIKKQNYYWKGNKDETYSAIIHFSRRKDAPPKLINMIKKLKSMEENLKNIKTEQSEFLNKNIESSKLTVTDVLKIQSDYKNKIWKKYREITKYKREITNYPIIPLTIPKFKIVELPQN